MDNIIRMTKDLGKLIQADARYVAMEHAKEIIDNDEALQAQIGEFNIAKMNLNTELSKDNPEKNKVTELDSKVRSLHDEIMSNRKMQMYSDVQGEISELMNKINTILTYSLNGYDPETADEIESCSGSCSSCGGGCHH